MSEYTLSPPPRPENAPVVDLEAQARQKLEALQSEPSPHNNEPSDASLDRLRAEVAELATTGHESQPQDDSERVAEAARYAHVAHEDIRAESYDQLMHTVRAQLSPRDRSLSQLYHSPVMDTVSEAAAKTIARPIGLMIGGLIATVGTLISLIAAQTYGLSYSYLLFISLFIIGYLTGTLIEFGLQRLRHHH